MEMSSYEKRKIHRVLSEFKNKELKSGSGVRVKSRRQALAIAMSEAGISKKGKGK